MIAFILYVTSVWVYGFIEFSPLHSHIPLTLKHPEPYSAIATYVVEVKL